MKNKPELAQYKLGNCYYNITNNKLKCFIEGEWQNSQFNTDEFFSENPINLRLAKYMVTTKLKITVVLTVVSLPLVALIINTLMGK